jgi:hypothetical protein
MIPTPSAAIFGKIMLGKAALSGGGEIGGKGFQGIPSPRAACALRPHLALLHPELPAPDARKGPCRYMNTCFWRGRI